MSEAWNNLRSRIHELESLTGILGLLEWDQQTYMPPGGAGHRTTQRTALASIVHEKLTDPHLADWLSQVDDEQKANPDPIQAASVRNISRLHRRASRVPRDLVRASARAHSEGFRAWLAARQAGDFSIFEPKLEQIVKLAQQTTACHGPADHPYDHLIAEYDPGSHVGWLQPMFKRLSRELTDFVREVKDRTGPAPLTLAMDIPTQLRLGERVIEAIGFRTDEVRLDLSEHPFTVGLGPHDVRLTTHLDRRDAIGGLFCTIHECGHGLYEQGLPDEYEGTGLATAAGMGLHESQSRFWENLIGRSRPFCHWLLTQMNELWDPGDLTAQRLYEACNRVEPSLIRVKADEATYNLHIIVRFQLELALLEGSLTVSELPDAWRETYQEIVTVAPDTSLDGVLQDVHWAGGHFGYFPAYTIGNLYAASFMYKMEEDLPQMWDEVEKGEFSSVLGWLNKRIHSRGSCATGHEIFTEVVGERDPVSDLMNHLRQRHGTLYGLS